MYGPSLQKEILALWPLLRLKIIENLQPRVDLRVRNVPTHHSRNSRVLRHRLQSALGLKRKVANPIGGKGKKAARKVNRTGPLSTRSARYATASKTKQKIPRQNLLLTQFIRSLLAVWCNEQFGRRARCHQKHKVFKQNPIFFLLTDLKLPDTAFENAESEIGSFLDDQEEQIFHDDLSSEDGFWSPKAYSI